MGLPIDSLILQRLTDGDELAFDLVYKEYSSRVYQLAFRFMKQRAASEEILQETFIRLWLNRHQIDCNGNIWLYLYVITKRLALNELRQVAKSTALTAQLFTAISELHNSTEEEIMAADMERFTASVIEKLPKQQQTIFRLSRFSGLSHKEIADQLGISQHTVKNHMVQALKTIKAQLTQVELFYFLALLFWVS